MTKTLLFLTLMLVAPVAGAYQGFHCKDCTLTDVHTNQDQPAGEAKPDCPEIDCGLNNPSGKMCSLDLATGCVVYVEQSEAEKWRSLCQDYSDSCESTGYSCDRAQIYCTRAILEEMRNK